MPDGGGGGDGGAAQREKEEQSRRATAIDQVNSYFGVAPVAQTIQTKAAVPGVQKQVTYGERGNQILSGPKVGGSPAVTAANPLIDAATKNAADRTALYDTTRQNVLDLNLKKLSDYAIDAENARKFSLASKGLVGGSVDIDSAARLKRDYDQGATDASTQADQAGVDFRTADEQSRANLINQINAGGDVNTAVTGGRNALQLNADNANAGAQGRVINNTFGDLAQQYAYGQAGAGVTDAVTRAALLKKNAAAPGNSGFSGTVTK